MTVITRAVLAIVSCCLFSTVSRADNAAEQVAAAVDRAFRPLLEAHNVPGMAVAVTVSGRQYFFSYGVASKETNTPVTKDTLFEIGSISKTFTATLAGLAQTLGKLSLDDRPGKHMPQLQGSAIDKASLLHLGTYTAGGLPLQFPDKVTGDAGMAAYFREWKPSAAPGAQRRYSNSSIGLLGHITGLAMNGNFADLVEAELFPKLGLSRSFIRVPEAEARHYAWGYSKDDKPIQVRLGVLGAEAYGVKSTAADMIRFIEANIQPDMLPMPIRGAVEGTHIGYFKVGEMVQGLGWEQYPYPIALDQKLIVPNSLEQLSASNGTRVALDRILAGNSGPMVMEANAATPLASPQAPSGPTLFNKTGSTNGFGAYAVFVPARKIGLVMLANKNFPNPARITAAHAVLEQLSAGTP